MLRSTRTFVAIALIGVLTATSSVFAQEEPEGFPLPASTTYCEPGYYGPFVDCEPWAGVTVTYTSSDGTFTDTCTTADAPRAATCNVYVPFGSTITASIDPSVVPSGYVLEKSASQIFEIPDGPPEGLFGGPSYVLLPDDSGDTGGTGSAIVATLIAILLEILAGMG